MLRYLLMCATDMRCPTLTHRMMIGSFTCSCNTGYESTGAWPGVVCVDVDECLGNAGWPHGECDANADCQNTEGSYTCACKAGWTGTDSAGSPSTGVQCFDENECDTGADPCDTNAECTNNDGSFTCKCNAGYDGTKSLREGLPGECDDIDECFGPAPAHNCDSKASCANQEGSFTCTCNDGYDGSGITCEDVDECENELDNNCDKDHATCADSPEGSYTCACNEGFSGFGIACLSDSVCDSLGCPPNANCWKDPKNQASDWECVCDGPAYTGNGTWCQENECATGSHNCHAKADCTDSSGSFSCSCQVGWTGNGTDCQDVNECRLGGMAETVCAAESACENVDGSFACTCMSGYEDTSKGWGKSCEDIDECEEEMHNCHPGLAVCRNTRGSFACACNEGYTDDSERGVTCRDLDECTEGRGNEECDVNARCDNNLGSFACVCYDGFKGNGTNSDGGCEDVDECAEDLDDCDEHASCTNFVGLAVYDAGSGRNVGFICSCLAGWRGEDGTTCTDIDECEENSFECDENSDCFNTD
eukprot:3150104-Rhodomonas_salina.3